MADLDLCVTDNLRFAVDWCLLGYPDNKNAASTPCVGSCKTIQDVLKANITAPGLNTPYGYCQDGAFMAGVDLCVSCNALDDNQSYPSNCKRLNIAHLVRYEWIKIMG